MKKIWRAIIIVIVIILIIIAIYCGLGAFVAQGAAAGTAVLPGIVAVGGGLVSVLGVTVSVTTLWVIAGVALISALVLDSSFNEGKVTKSIAKATTKAAQAVVSGVSKVARGVTAAIWSVIPAPVKVAGVCVAGYFVYKFIRKEKQDVIIQNQDR